MTRPEQLKVKIAQSCPTVGDPMDYIVHGILQVRILEWIAFPYSSWSSQPKDQAQASHIEADSSPAEPPGKPKNARVGSLSLLQQSFPTQELNWCLEFCRRNLSQLCYQERPEVDQKWMLESLVSLK